MAYLHIDRPWEANLSAAAMESWLADLAQMEREFTADGDALDSIALERQSALAALDALRVGGDATEAEDDFDIEPDTDG